MSAPDLSITLDPSDPFERALVNMILTNRRKRRDYALDGDPFSNFTATARFANFPYRWMSQLFNCSQKLARITSLTANGRVEETANEAVGDTLEDNAVYAVLAYADYLWTAEQAAQASKTHTAPLVSWTTD